MNKPTYYEILYYCCLLNTSKFTLKWNVPIFSADTGVAAEKQSTEHIIILANVISTSLVKARFV